MNPTETAFWPRLREELTVQEGPRLHDGQPSWTLYDPGRHLFFRLDWLTFEILQRWSLSDPEQIARQVSVRTSLKAEAGDVVAALEFLQKNQLLHLSSSVAGSRWAEWVESRRQSWLKRLVGNYLFFRVPLFDPTRLLRFLYDVLEFAFKPAFWWLTAIAFAVGVSAVWRQWDVFASTFMDLRAPGQWTLYLLVLVAVKVLHEIGHGLASVRYGLRTPSMGVAFMVLMPLAYTDTTDAWRLKRRRPRLVVGAAGMLVELVIAVWATVAWALLPSGAARDAAFILATVTWIKSLVINLSPVMRFDGYYLLSDALDLPNLHERCFALARWKLREWLFALKQPPPEFFEAPMRRALVALGFAIWIYRFLLFLAIAALVYTMFFKLLGVALFVVEIVCFIALPIWREVRQWYGARAVAWRTPRTKLTLLGGAALIAVVALPLPRQATLSAYLHPERQWSLGAPGPAKLASVAVVDGAVVAEGAPLFTFTSDVLDWNLARSVQLARSAQAEIAVARLDENRRGEITVLEARLATAFAAEREARAALDRLSVVSPGAGVFRIAHPDLTAGETLEKDEPLALVYDPEKWVAEGYITDDHRHRIEVGMSGRFFAEGDSRLSFALVVRAIEQDTTRELSDAILATANGGGVEAQQVDGVLRPERAVYRVILEVVNPGAMAPDAVRRGKVVVHGAAEPIALGWLRQGASILWRELGF